MSSRDVAQSRPADVSPPVSSVESAAETEAEHSPEVRAHYRSILWIVTSLGLLWAVESGIDSGIGPCSFTTLTEKLDASVTSVTVAQTMAEVTKTAGSLFVAVFTTSAAVQNAMVCAGGLIMAGGTFLVGVAPNVAAVGAGFFFIGLGLSFLAVLCPPILEYYVVSRPHRHKVVFYLTVVYAGASLGVAVAFGVCGATIEMAWRWNYIGAVLVLLPIVASVALADRWAAATRKALPPSELSEKALPEDDGTPNANPLSPTTATGDNAGDGGAKAAAEALAAAALRLKPCVMPWWRIWIHTKLLLADSCFRWAIVFEIASSFYVTSYVVLLPVFLEHEYGLTKGQVAAVLAALIPSTALGLVASGVLVKHYRMGLERQLFLILVTSVMSVPIAFGFFLPLVPFLIVLIVGMFIVFANVGPSRTVFPLIVDAALMVPKLHEAIPDYEAAVLAAEGGATVGAGDGGRGPKPNDDRGLLGGAWSVAMTTKPVPIQYVDEDEDAKTAGAAAAKNGAPGTGSTDDAPVEIHPGVQSQSDVIAREVLVAHANAVSNVFHRVLGSVPGPIILAALVDHTALPRAWCFFIVGFVSMSIGALGAYMSWKESPEVHQPIQPAAETATSLAESPGKSKNGPASIVYVDDDPTAAAAASTTTEDRNVTAAAAKIDMNEI